MTYKASTQEEFPGGFLEILENLEEVIHAHQTYVAVAKSVFNSFFFYINSM